MKSEGFECYRIGDLMLDAGTQEVSRNGSPVPVPRLSFRLLLSLVRHAPNVVSTQKLEEEVWKGLVVDKGTINKRVLLLRKALGENKGEGPYITVIRGSGYRLAISVEPITESPKKAEPVKDDTQSWYQRSSRSMRTISYWLLGIVAILALYQGFQNRVPKSPRTDVAVATDKVQPSVVNYSRQAVAVLPFVDLSDGQAHQYLGDGIAEEVINLLAGMEGLEVAARTSSFSFRDSSLTAMEIAGDLHVGTILEGSLRHEGSQIRVTAQLIDTSNGYHIWSESYDGTIDQVFEMQDDIALNIAQALQLTLDEGSKPDSRRMTTANFESFSFYLKGRELLNDRIHLREAGLRDAQKYFWKSVELDPGFARAHASIAAVYWLLTSYDQSLDKDVYFEQAEASAHFALELDPESTEAMSVLASIHSARGEIEQAAALFDRIREFDNNDFNNIHWQAMLHMRLGYFDELINQLKDSYQKDPLNEHIGWSLASAYTFSGHTDEAEEILQNLQNFTYRDYNLGLTAIYAGNYSQAREKLRDVRLRSGILPAAYADMLIDAFEDPDGPDACADKFVVAALEGKLDPLISFEALLILGSPRAFDLNIDPFTIGKTQILAQVWNSWGSELRQDPRFKVWVEELGWLDFWRKHGWPDRCRPTSPIDFECI